LIYQESLKRDRRILPVDQALKLGLLWIKERGRISILMRSMPLLALRGFISGRVNGLTTSLIYSKGKAGHGLYQSSLQVVNGKTPPTAITVQYPFLHQGNLRSSPLHGSTKALNLYRGGQAIVPDLALKLLFWPQENQFYAAMRVLIVCLHPGQE
jgi:hypothetical protein